jgi:hypothetical protein
MRASVVWTRSAPSTADSKPTGLAIPSAWLGVVNPEHGTFKHVRSILVCMDAPYLQTDWIHLCGWLTAFEARPDSHQHVLGFGLARPRFFTCISHPIPHLVRFRNLTSRRYHAARAIAQMAPPSIVTTDYVDDKQCPTLVRRPARAAHLISVRRQEVEPIVRIGAAVIGNGRAAQFLIKECPSGLWDFVQPYVMVARIVRPDSHLELRRSRWRFFAAMIEDCADATRGEIPNAARPSWINSDDCRLTDHSEGCFSQDHSIVPQAHRRLTVQ